MKSFLGDIVKEQVIFDDISSLLCICDDLKLNNIFFLSPLSMLNAIFLLHNYNGMFWSNDPFEFGDHFIITFPVIHQNPICICGECLWHFSILAREEPSYESKKKASVKECVMLLLKGGVVLFLLLCLIWNADAAENLSVGRECIEGGVEDRGQVKPKHGAQKKQSPKPFSPHYTLQ